MKTSDEPSVPFRKFGFVDAVEELDPTGSLGLLDPDFKVSVFLCIVFVFALSSWSVPLFYFILLLSSFFVDGDPF